jgi:thioredoxin reductase (NADPH)
MPKEQIIIIGGGPAGCACAIQLKRYGFDPLLIEKDSIGGLVKNAWRMDNYPGYPQGISGIEMVSRLKDHVERFGIRTLNAELGSLNFEMSKEFVGECDGTTYTSQYFVIATGTKPKHSGGGLTEVYPVRDVRGKSIAIVGAGDAAFDYAMTLSPHNIIHIHNRGTRIKCVPALLEIALTQDNITYVENSLPADNYDYTIFATGREPDLDCLSEQMLNLRPQLEQDGLLYVIGDVKNGMVRQTSVATGDGIRAAMAIKDRISKE